MAEVITVKKVDTWARVPVKGSYENEFILYNAYQTTLPSLSCKEVSTGLILPPLENKTVLLMGQPARHCNKGLEVRRRFLGANEEVVFNMLNTQEEDIAINPYSFTVSIVVLRVAGGAPKVVDDLNATERGDKGFGSTGKI